jgi:hypothetical protein
VSPEPAPVVYTNLNPSLSSASRILRFKTACDIFRLLAASLCDQVSEIFSKASKSRYVNFTPFISRFNVGLNSIRLDLLFKNSSTDFLVVSNVVPDYV